MTQIKDWLWEDKKTTLSTNDDALFWSSKLTNNEKFIISAEEQTQGRGRRGRNWISLKGNLFFSLGLPFDLQNLGQLICISSLSLFQTVAELLPEKHQLLLKWPNDVLLNDCKISGILLEKGAGDYIVIGIGVNINAVPSCHDTMYKTVSLRECGINIDRLAFLRSYINKFDNNYKQWRSYGFSDIRSQWLTAVKGIGEPISVHTDRENIQGIFLGIGEAGELLLKTEEKICKIYAGDVFYIKKEEINE